MSEERPIRLHAGPWSLEFERWSGWLRNIRYNDIEVVRSVYATARGADWRTYPSHICTSHVAQGDCSFEVGWEAKQEGIAVDWIGHVEGDSGTLQVSFNASIGADIETRRTGMSVLLPQELAGSEVEIGKTNGEIEKIAMPMHIAPHSPATDIAAVNFQLKDVDVQIHFDGDDFEMEDQRNWGDSSFKVYSRPQRLPQPYSLLTGAYIEHRVRITARTIEGEDGSTQCPRSESVGPFPVPLIGTVSHSMVEGLDFFLPQPVEHRWSKTFDGKIAEYSSFVDFNRDRTDAANLDGVAFAVNPQSHAVDDRSVMENTQTISSMLQSARAIFPDVPIYLGPITLSEPGLSDARMADPFGAAWLAANLIQASFGGASAMTILHDYEWDDRLLQIVAQFSRQSISPIPNLPPYVITGCRLSNGGTVLVNLTPFLQLLKLNDADLELSGYEVRFIVPND